MLMSLVENINKRKKAGTSRPKSKSTVSPKAYAKMKSGYRDGGMIDQMSDQMDMSRKEAGGLMNKASMMNDMAGYKKGGSVMVISIGSMKPLMRNKEEHSEDSTLIKSTENQVRARHFNNNGGKGTF